MGQEIAVGICQEKFLCCPSFVSSFLTLGAEYQLKMSLIPFDTEGRSNQFYLVKYTSETKTNHRQKANGAACSPRAGAALSLILNRA